MWWTIPWTVACALPEDALTRGLPIPAASGGAVDLGDGAHLEVPPGALAADALVTLTRDTCSGAWASPTFASCRYTVDSGGVGWLGRFTLELPVTGEATTMVRDASDGLRPLLDTRAAPGRLSASGSSDGTFTARASGGPPDDRCTDVPFEPCGGDVTGHWDLTDACGSASQIVGISSEGPDPYADCAPFEAVVDEPWDVAGSVTFDADGTFSASSAVVGFRHQTLTLGCLEVVGQDCNPECTNDGSTCDCTYTQFAANGGWGGAWVETPDGPEIEGIPYRACVDGDVLAFEFPHPDGPFLQVYARSGTR